MIGSAAPHKRAAFLLSVPGRTPVGAFLAVYFTIGLFHFYVFLWRDREVKWNLPASLPFDYLQPFDLPGR